jgi:hypothetical protein
MAHHCKEMSSKLLGFAFEYFFAVNCITDGKFVILIDEYVGMRFYETQLVSV